jgi:DNA-binding NtrC family response regulator
LLKKLGKILVVDDDPSIRETLEAVLAGQYPVLTAPDGETALSLVENEDVRIVLLDIIMPGMDGIEVLRKIKERFGDVDVVMVTMVREAEKAVAAMKLGAYDYITKEFDYDEVLALVNRIYEKQEQARKVRYLTCEIESIIPQDIIIGATPKMLAVYEVVQRVSSLPATVLLMGESGTGKDMIARLIHKNSDRSDAPFVTVNLASIPKDLLESTLFGHEKGAFTGAHKMHFGKFELANGGTIFLDEIGDLPFDLQAKLLRVIQSGEIERVGGGKTIRIDTRIVAATNLDLKKAVEAGRFREDLFYRINVIPITMPPLRERLEDIPELVNLFIERYNQRFRKSVRGAAAEVVRLFSRYNWPGNIRELENLIERMVAVVPREVITIEDLPMEFCFESFKDFSAEAGTAPRRHRFNTLRKAREAFESQYILRVLERCRWNQTEAARELNLNLSSLKYRIRRLGLEKASKPHTTRGRPLKHHRRPVTVRRVLHARKKRRKSLVLPPEEGEKE